MRRRDVIAGLAVAAAVGRARAEQQTAKVYRIAMVEAFIPVTEMSETSHDPIEARAYGTFFDEIRRLGYVEGRNLTVERYSGEGRPAHFRELADNVVRDRPDLTYTFSSDMVLAFKAATATIPIVFICNDPVALGIVSSLARPGGNITGSSVDAGIEIWGKRLALLREAIPTLSRLGALITPTVLGSRALAQVKEASETLHIRVFGQVLDSPINESAYRRAFAAMTQERADAVYVADELEHFQNMRVIVELAERARLPAIYPWRESAEFGGLMAYAFEVWELIRHNADIIDLILKGAKPGDIPIYQAQKYALVINLKTAKALGLTIPASLLTRADDVIE
jgi:putative ABC transport system substrate-binding protein